MSAETPNLTFPELGLPAPLLQALDKVGYESPSPIQAASIPVILSGRDMIGQAQTGTGKTAAFALPLLARIDTRQNHPQVLVLTPTRELAIQVAEAFQTYASFLADFHVLPVYGGQDFGNQLRRLKRGPQVVVGTPGRLLDHLRRNSLDLSGIHSLVLDEADEMLRMGFIEDVETILSHTSGEQQTALFSATLPEPIRRVSQRFLKDPAHIKIASKTTTVETIDQRYLLANNNQKMDALTRLLEVEDADGIIIFVRTRGATTEVTEKLIARGYTCGAINGDMSQQLRERMISQLKKGKIDILVATDVAARGLDVERISHVINYDIPYDSEAYVHRIGRTGRAGRQGKAILFVTHREQRMLRSIEKATGKPIERMRFPSTDEVAVQRRERFRDKLVEAMAQTPQPFFTDFADALVDELNCDPRTLAASLIYMLQKERPLEIVEAPAARDEKPAEAPDKQDRDTQPKAGRDIKPRKHTNLAMVQYRLEVGQQQGATARDIVGALANEADIDSAYIGHIDIHEDYSTVELPEGMPREIFNHLKRVRVRNHPMQLSLIGEAPTPPTVPARKPRKPRPAEHKPARAAPGKRKSRPGKNARKAAKELK